VTQLAADKHCRCCTSLFSSWYAN